MLIKVSYIQTKFREGHILLTCWMVCNRSWHLTGSPKLPWHPARLIKEEGCVDLSVDTLHLKDPLVLFGSEGSVLTLPIFLLSLRIVAVSLFFTNDKGPLFWFKPSLVHSRGTFKHELVKGRLHSRGSRDLISWFMHLFRYWRFPCPLYFSPDRAPLICQTSLRMEPGFLPSVTGNFFHTP